MTVGPDVVFPKVGIQRIKKVLPLSVQLPTGVGVVATRQRGLAVHAGFDRYATRIDDLRRLFAFVAGQLLLQYAAS